ncbi:MAG TPA: hypothetical protein IAB06_04595 [Candidatus Avacidaminococcus intestinavium]|uniref:Uncharacterized protein n=1 Tax=Candidatus Avacidaminococcus intestinavium TaxID=2840684 RepID=A0A9D1MPY2_9FIRM|nr:hypothetical protein [Candidatus Avacidaminococcus intestinavium]
MIENEKMDFVGYRLTLAAEILKKRNYGYNIELIRRPEDSEKELPSLDALYIVRQYKIKNDIFEFDVVEKRRKEV